MESRNPQNVIRVTLGESYEKIGKVLVNLCCIYVMKFKSTAHKRLLSRLSKTIIISLERKTNPYMRIIK